MNVGIYFTDEEYEFIKSKPEGWVRTLVRSAMGVVSEIDPPVEEIVKRPPEKIKKRPEAPKIEGVFKGIEDLAKNSDKPKCKSCGWPVDRTGKCLQKKCKLFLKPQ